MSIILQLCLQGKILYYVDGKYKRNTNWMLHIQCARNSEEQNVEAIQIYGYVRFRTTKVIAPGSELKVFYSEEYAQHVGFRMKLDDLIYKKGRLSVVQNDPVGAYNLRMCR